MNAYAGAVIKQKARAVGVKRSQNVPRLALMQSASSVGILLYPHDAHVEWQLQPLTATVSSSFSNTPRVLGRRRRRFGNDAGPRRGPGRIVHDG